MDGLLLASRKLERSKPVDKYWKLSWEDVCGTFNTLCLSWNPDLFPNVIAHHRYAFHHLICGGNSEFIQYVEEYGQET